MSEPGNDSESIQPGPVGRAGPVRFHPSVRDDGPLPPLHVERLYGLFGVEQSLDDVSRTLRQFVQAERPPCVGALLVTCSDAVERECRDAFERHFVRYLLPHLKLSARAEFHTANLGGRYEWGSAAMAEEHYADAQPDGAWKAMVLKINAHVSVDREPGGPVFGRERRYNNPAPGGQSALAALFAGDRRPFARDLADALRSEGVDRVEALCDPSRVRPEHRELLGAAASARLQARRAMLDIQDRAPSKPTLWLILPCVTLNRQAKDTEVPLGVYVADRRGREPHDEWCGLGDRPDRYRLRIEGDRIALDDAELRRPRRARDHRAMIAKRWRDAKHVEPIDPALRRAVKEAQDQEQSPYAKAALKGALELALAFAPVPAAAVLFGQGLIGIHHAQRARRLTEEAQADEAAREMLRDVMARVESLPAEQARHAIQLLHDEYAG